VGDYGTDRRQRVRRRTDRPLTQAEYIAAVEERQMELFIQWFNRRFPHLRYCPMCQTPKPLDTEFNMNNRYPDGKAVYCSECARRICNDSRERKKQLQELGR
jgi:hypothetical protein